MRPRVLIIHATGTNRDLDVAQAVKLAGGEPEILHINLLKERKMGWGDFQMLVIPGGFSYADALGAGKLLAIDLLSYFYEEIHQFVDLGKPVIGICNGFQVLVKSGLLPGNDNVKATLTFNQLGHFECRWVKLLPNSQNCIWTRGLEQPIECPVAHGEGNFVLGSANDLESLHSAEQLALIYAGNDGHPAGGKYPANPNGSIADLAGVCNPRGNVLGLMPHPENHIFPYQHPQWTRGIQRGSGLPLFENGIRYAAGL